MFSFSKLQAAMTKMRFKDDSALRTIGLAKLSKTFDAYPLTEDGQKIFVLVPRGMEPTMAQKLENHVAVNSVLVLVSKEAGMEKIWPNAEALQAAANFKPPVPSSPKLAAALRPKVETQERVELDFEIVEE